MSAAAPLTKHAQKKRALLRRLADLPGDPERPLLAALWADLRPLMARRSAPHGWLDDVRRG